MASFVKLDENNIVIDGVALSNESVNELPFPESEPVGIAFLHELYGNNDTWLQTSYSNSFRGNYAGLGYSYRSDIDQFVPPSPYPSWIYDPNTAQWEAPVPKPYPPPSGFIYVWDEQTQSWVLQPRNNTVEP